MHTQSHETEFPHCYMKYSQKSSCVRLIIDRHILLRSRRSGALLCRAFTNFLRSILGAAAFQANYLSVLLGSRLGLSCQRDVQRLIHYIEWFSLFEELLE